MKNNTNKTNMLQVRQCETFQCAFLLFDNFFQITISASDLNMNAEREGIVSYSVGL